MNREQKINDFLKYFAKIFSQNPDLIISEDLIYAQLKLYNLTKEEINDGSIENNFINWGYRFSNNQNLVVFQSNSQPGFLQFQNRRNKDDNYVKLYLSYSKDKIYDCVNKIFDFISSNNMSTASKVAKALRSDSLVLRMANFDDAIKVMDFINNDPELNFYAKETNPFLIKNGKVGMAYDENLSYNATLAMLLSNYYNYCKNNNLLGNVSMYHFKEYVSLYYSNTFKNINNLREFTRMNNFSKMSNRFNSVGDEIVNYENIIKFIIMSLNENISIEQFRQCYNNCINKNNNEIMASYYNKSLSNGFISKESVEQQDVNIFNKYIEIASRKYSVEEMLGYLNSYISGNITAITRDRDLRQLFKIHMTPKKILAITNNNVSLYINNYLNQKNVRNDSNYQETLTSSYYDLFINACMATYNKYGRKQLYQALVSGTLGDYQYFTNDNNYRDNLIKYINRFEFYKFVCQIALTSKLKTIDINEKASEIISGMAQEQLKQNVSKM